MPSCRDEHKAALKVKREAKAKADAEWEAEGSRRQRHKWLKRMRRLLNNLKP
jgi:hypothetical protein